MAGSSGGWRTLIASRVGDRAVFPFGFAKNHRDTIGPDHLADLKEAAHELLALSTKQIAKRLDDHALSEVPYG